MAKKEGKKGGGAKKIGRDQAKCKRYKERGRRNVNARKRLERHIARFPGNAGEAKSALARLGERAGGGGGSHCAQAELDLRVCRKVPMQLNPQCSMGAAVDDGTVILNEEAIKMTGLSRQQIEIDINRVRADIKQRSLLYRSDRPIIAVGGKTVIIIDDGLASGFTMMAAVESVRHRQPREIIVAVPVASAIAVKRLEKVANEVVACNVGYMPKFYLSDFYRYWYDVSDNDVVKYLREWRALKFRGGMGTATDDK